MPKDNNEVEIERQQSEMLGKGASHNEIYNANTRAEYNNTGYLPNQGHSSSGRSSRQSQPTNAGRNQTAKRGRQAPARTTQKNTKESSSAVFFIGGAIAGYFLAVTYLTDNLIVAGLLGLLSGYILYKWGKKLIIAAIILALVYFFFLKDN